MFFLGMNVSIDGKRAQRGSIKLRQREEIRIQQITKQGDGRNNFSYKIVYTQIIKSSKITSIKLCCEFITNTYDDNVVTQRKTIML